MTDKKPVVVYGASGYTGRLVCEYLRELHLPFIAAGRDRARVQAVMDKIPGIETAEYEVAQVDHNVKALTKLFRGAKVVSNMVGPFSKYGPEVAEACLAAGCHCTDTTGEQDWVLDAKTRFGAKFAEKGLLLSPGVAQMYTTGEIAANICLETPGLDTLDILVLWKGFPTYASTQTIFAILQAKWYYLEQNKFVEWAQNTHFDVNVPGQHVHALVTPWAGTSHPVWFKDDPLPKSDTFSLRYAIVAIPGPTVIWHVSSLPGAAASLHSMATSRCVPSSRSQHRSACEYWIRC